MARPVVHPRRDLRRTAGPVGPAAPTTRGPEAPMGDRGRHPVVGRTGLPDHGRSAGWASDTRRASRSPTSSGAFPQDPARPHPAPATPTPPWTWSRTVPRPPPPVVHSGLPARWTGSVPRAEPPKGAQPGTARAGPRGRSPWLPGRHGQYACGHCSLWLRQPLVVSLPSRLCPGVHSRWCPVPRCAPPRDATSPDRAPPVGGEHVCQYRG